MVAIEPLTTVHIFNGVVEIIEPKTNVAKVNLPISKTVFAKFSLCFSVNRIMNE